VSRRWVNEVVYGWEEVRAQEDGVMEFIIPSSFFLSFFLSSFWDFLFPCYFIYYCRALILNVLLFSEQWQEELDAMTYIGRNGSTQAVSVCGWWFNNVCVVWLWWIDGSNGAGAQTWTYLSIRTFPNRPYIYTYTQVLAEIHIMKTRSARNTYSNDTELLCPLAVDFTRSRNNERPFSLLDCHVRASCV